MSPKERISVAMAAYNGERFKSQQLESLARQTRLPDELVVSDDCSTDQTVEILNDFAKCAQFSVRVLVNEINVGFDRNFERVIAECTGDLIFLCDQDDVWFPAKIERMADALVRHPSAGMVISNSELVDENTISLERCLYTRKLPSKERYYSQGAEAVDIVLAAGLCFGHTMAFRRTTEMIEFSAKSRINYNYDVFRVLVAGAFSGIVVLPSALTKYRRHGNQQSSSRDLSPSLFGRLRNVLFDSRRSMASRTRFAQAIPPICQLLTAHGASPGAVDIMAGRAAIAAFQANLPSSRFRRIVPILKNLLTWKYHRFANGMSTAARDFLISTPPV